MDRKRRTSALAGLVCAGFGLGAHGQVREFDFAVHLRKAVQDQCPAPAATLDSVEFVDFTGDGVDEAVVVASTCLTGTAGPDVHAVFQYDAAAGTVREIPIAEAKEFRGRPLYAHLVGNRNKRLRVDGGALVEDYYDGSGREHPLTIRYRLEKGTFQPFAVEWPAVYRASFDCGRARTPNEMVICAHADLAAGDRLMERAYRQRLTRLPARERTAFRAAQAAWLKDRDQICVPYKGEQGADCLRELYARRRAQLQAP